MADQFALLGELRRPWLDPGALKAKFLSLSSQFHPDRFHGESEEEKRAGNIRYAEANAAYNCLRTPKDRLLHLLELERGTRPSDVQRIPPGTMELFVEVGEMCRKVDDFLTRSNTVVSPMLKVRSLEESLDWFDQLKEVLAKVTEKGTRLETELQEMNSSWEKAADDPVRRRQQLPLDRLEQIYRILSYVHRWTEQIQERLVQLSNLNLVAC